MVKNLPAKQERWVRSLGQEDPLEKEMAIHSRLLCPWDFPGKNTGINAKKTRSNQWRVMTFQRGEVP